MKIEFIKENELFAWKVGDKRIIKGDYIDVRTTIAVNNNSFINIAVKGLTNLGYIKEVKEPSLVERVDFLVEKFTGKGTAYSWDVVGSKYRAIAMYDHIVEELNEGEKPDSGFFIDFIRKSQTPRIYKQISCSNIVKEAKTTGICQAMIDSKVFRPYLRKIFSIKD